MERPLQNLSPEGGEGNRVTVASLEPQWAAEIAAATRLDYAGQGLSETEIEAQVTDQLSKAAKIASSILESNEFVDADQVASIMGAQLTGFETDEVELLREEGSLIHVMVNGQALYPRFQFRESGLPHIVVGEINALFSPGKSSWHSAVWWFLTTSRLGNRTANEWLESGEDPQALVELFREIGS
jgi:hypothetical protein